LIAVPARIAASPPRIHSCPIRAGSRLKTLLGIGQRGDCRPRAVRAVPDLPADQRRRRAGQHPGDAARALLLAAGCAVFAFATLAAYEVVVVRYVKHCIGRAKP
jgi:hypothetical protein